VEKRHETQTRKPRWCCHSAECCRKTSFFPYSPCATLNLARLSEKSSAFSAVGTDFVECFTPGIFSTAGRTPNLEIARRPAYIIPARAVHGLTSIQVCLIVDIGELVTCAAGRGA
jgi:hypothetical protein